MKHVVNTLNITQTFMYLLPFDCSMVIYYTHRRSGGQVSIVLNTRATNMRKQCNVFSLSLSLYIYMPVVCMFLFVCICLSVNYVQRDKSYTVSSVYLGEVLYTIFGVCTNNRPTSFVKGIEYGILT